MSDSPKPFDVSRAVKRMMREAKDDGFDQAEVAGEVKRLLRDNDAFKAVALRCRNEQDFENSSAETAAYAIIIGIGAREVEFTYRERGDAEDVVTSAGAMPATGVNTVSYAIRTQQLTDKLGEYVRAR